MGILTRLRNAFGRRKGRTAAAEGAEQIRTQEPSPTPEPAPTPEPSAQQEPKAQLPSPAPEPSADPTATPHVPDPRTSPRLEREEHELVAAAFDNVTVPKPSRPVDPPQREQQQTEQPATEEPPTEKPSADQPADDKPAAAEPADEKPVTEEPADEKPTTETPSAEKPSAADRPSTEEPPAETEPTAETEPAAEADPTTEPEPTTEPATTTTEPEPTAEPATTTTEPEPTAEPATTTTEPATTTPTPQAADDEDTPQGPPAPDNTSRTGGAGENEPPAEGEAEAPANPAPTTAPETETPRKPATPLTRVKSRAPGLTTAYKAATATLKKHDLTGTRAKVYLVLDRSASMRPYYKDGSAQALAEQALALAAHLDPEATVHVTFFSTEVDGTTVLTLTDHENKIDEVHATLGRMGRTSYHAAVAEVIAQHRKSADPESPALVIFQTDGAPDAKTPATRSLTDAAKNHPSLFFSFVAFGEHDNKAFDYLRKLKTDNTSFFHAGPTPRELTDKELYEGVLSTWRP
ncbi:VWA domain-containing protein [Streptomyces mexicanus]|uniref:VWA domain-containing protein n=1 Tax=Streptomyces mexicanus TaxID=178566 RepID=UPI0031EA7FA9